MCMLIDISLDIAMNKTSTQQTYLLDDYHAFDHICF